MSDPAIVEIEPLIAVLTAMVDTQREETDAEVLKRFRLYLRDFLGSEPVEPRADDEDYILALLLILFIELPMSKIVNTALLIDQEKLFAYGRKNVITLPDKLPNPVRTDVWRLKSLAEFRFWLNHRYDPRMPKIKTTLTELLRQYKKGMKGLDAAVQGLKEVLEAGAANQSKIIAEAWAIRAVNLSTLDAADQLKIEALIVFNNPPKGPDGRTTPFCRHIHGKSINVQRALKMVEDYYKAVADDDIDAAKDAWPMVSSEVANGDEAAFRKAVAELRIGLPPYHAGCRDVLFPALRARS